MLSWMQPMTVALPLAGMAPTTGYCGPGPERTLSGITADATIAAEDADVTATAAAARSVVLIRIADLLVSWEYLRVTFRPRVRFRWNSEADGGAVQIVFISAFD